MKIQLYGADKKLQQTVQVERHKSKFDGYDYTVRNTLSNVEGYVEIRFKDTSWFEDRAEPVFEILDRIVPEGDLIAEIQRFYPHKVPRAWLVPRQFQHRGIGTSVLTTVLHDLSLDGFRNFYCNNPEEEFYRILLQQQFRELHAGDKNEHLFKRVAV